MTALAEIIGAHLAVGFFLLLLVVIGWQGQKKAEPPAELVAAVSAWPPPRLPRARTAHKNYQEAWAAIAADRANQWGPPLAWTRITDAELWLQ